jgi:nicotinate-nucleotide adenylyltransferase
MTQPTAGLIRALRPGFHLEAGMRVGLFGGSFNPPHEGHAHVAETALRELDLDKVIWLVSPQNPLKGPTAMTLAERVAATRQLARGPKMVVSDIEARMGTNYTIDTLHALIRRFPGVQFVWLMGSDNLAGFHRWEEWKAIARLVPIAVAPRPGTTIRSSPAARLLHPIRLHGPLNFASSTALRARARVSPSQAAQGVEN